MVSKQSFLRPTPMTDECDYVRVGKGLKKEARDSIGMVADLRNFINQHFNIRPQVTLGEDGCMIITNLFDGTPDDIESQVHEIFDKILQMVGWIEGCIEPPTKFDGKINDDQSTEELKINGLQVQDEELVQMELKVQIDAAKEFSNLVTHQVLVEMPKSIDIKKSELIEHEEPNQLESIVAKEPLNPAAYQVLDEMLEPQTDLKALEYGLKTKLERRGENSIENSILTSLFGPRKFELHPYTTITITNSLLMEFNNWLPKQELSGIDFSMSNLLIVPSFPYVLLNHEHGVLKIIWVKRDYYAEMFDFDPGGGLHTTSEVALSVNASEIWGLFVWLNENFRFFWNDNYVKRLVLDSSGLCLVPPIMPSSCFEAVLCPCW